MAYTDIDDPTQYFNTVTYSGNGSGTQVITGVGHQPDWVWIKSRSSASENHMLSDVVRGSTKRLRSDITNAQDDLGSNGIQSFDTDGFTAGDGDAMNASGQTYVAWNWKAGGSASSNSDGDITSTVSANTTSGFSIVNFTKTDGEVTVGHGLNAKPSLIIFKPLASANWIVTPEINGSMSNNYLLLHNGDALGTDGAFSNPTTSVFSISNNIAPNSEHIAYCFANKKGFSKIGSYTGNGSTDGTFVYTGFKPAWTMIKRTTDATEAWIVQDNKRSPFNPSDVFLAPSSSDADATTTNAHIDYLSNGFKLRHNDTRGNTSGKNYLYMAFAESPLATSTGIPTTAR
jgi:hypothetical protein